MSDAVVKAVVGLRRYGKSTHVVQMTRDCPRVVFYDSLNDDYNQGIVCRTWREFAKLWLDCYQTNFRITFKPDNPLEYFDQFCAMAYGCGDCTIVVDEVQLYFRGAWCCPPFTKLITAGGHVDVELIGVTQAPKRLGELLRSQAHEWHVFALREDVHVKYVTDRCPGLSVDLIKTLPKYDYLHFVDGADCYWRCKDDPTTGRTWKEEINYEGQTLAVASSADSREHDDAVGPVGSESEDGSKGVPGPEAS